MGLQTVLGVYENPQDINDVFGRLVEDENESFIDAAVDFWNVWPFEGFEQVIIDEVDGNYRIVFQFDDHEIVFQAK